METNKKLSAEIREKVIAAVASDKWAAAIAATKAATDSGTFRMKITSEAVDRAGEVIKAAGWDFSDYMKNPVVLWAHDYSGLPVAITDSIEQIGTDTFAVGRFCPAEVNPMAQQVRAGYDFGVNRASSVGFMDLDREGNVITKASLLECLEGQG